MALSASSKSDFQQASIIRVTNPEKRAALAALIPAMPSIGAAPVLFVFCGDARRLERIGELCGHPEPNGRLEGFFNAAVDAALAMQTFILAAEAVGLGCCPISVIRNHVERRGDVLDLPEKVFPVAGLCVGWPAKEGYISLRLPPAVTLHRDRYDDAALPELIEAYDRGRDRRHRLAREEQRNPARFGYADFYGWSEDKARQAAQPEGVRSRPGCAARALPSIECDMGQGERGMAGETSTQASRRVWLPMLPIALFVATRLASSLAAAANPDEIKQPGYMVVVTEDDFRPFEFVQDGRPTGYDNELIEKLRKFVSFEIKQEIIPWTGLLAGVSTGKYDIAITAAIITKERQQSLDFSMPIAAVTDY